MYQLAASCLVSLLFVMSVIAAALAPGKSLAQEENALVPDRPGSGDSPLVVPSGLLLLEAGYNLTQADDQVIHNEPEALLRAGLAPRLEFRIGWVAIALPAREGR
jgi:hypothetical protein